jgi:hypothetical protein
MTELIWATTINGRRPMYIRCGHAGRSPKDVGVSAGVILDQSNQTVSGFLDSFRAAFAQYHASLLATKPVQMSPQEHPFKGTWPDGLHCFRVR